MGSGIVEMSMEAGRDVYILLQLFEKKTFAGNLSRLEGRAVSMPERSAMASHWLHGKRRRAKLAVRCIPKLWSLICRENVRTHVMNVRFCHPLQF